MRPTFYTNQPQANLLQPFALPPMLVGMDDHMPVYNAPQGVAIYLYNMIPAGYGIQTREGYITWAQNLAGGEVKSLMPFAGKTISQTDARLFAATQNGIYDITTRGADNPTAVVTFPDQSTAAGFISYVHFTDPTGVQSLLLADSRNGLYEYDPTGPTWTKYTTEITGPTPGNIAFVMSHKGRLWFIERDSADAWYLPPGQKAGTATKFQFGAKLRHGGFLVGLYNLSIDGGAGVDDYLLALARSGDVLIYRGQDPALATSWDSVGLWNIGEVPAGRRVVIENGGDLFLLSVYGVTSATGLISGFEPSRVERNVSGKVSSLLGAQIRSKISQDYWQIKTLPEEEALIINIPKGIGERNLQFALNISRVSEGSGGGWGYWRDVPATVFDSFLGNAYFGTVDSKVHRMSGVLDDVPLDDSTGKAIEFSILTGFSDFGLQARYKQVQFIRPAFLTSNRVFLASKAIYDFDLIEVIPGATNVPNFGSRWDQSNWDQAIWSGLTNLSILRGSGGYGRNVAIALRGEVISRTTLANIEGEFQPWGTK